MRSDYSLRYVSFLSFLTIISHVYLVCNDICTQEGTVMWDSYLKCQVWVFIHVLIIGADLQMRPLLASVNLPGMGSGLAFGKHKVSEDSTRVCLMYNAPQADF
jgi:hypothetical protein